MNFKFNLFLILLINNFVVFAYSTELDSLINQIDFTSNTIEKCDLFNQIGSIYLESNPNESLFYANKAFQLSLRDNYEEGLAEAYLIQGKANEEMDRYDVALNNLLSALIIHKSLGNQAKIAETNYLLGRICKTTGNYESAIEYCFNALRINEQREDYLGIASIYNTMGSIYKYIGDYDKALEYYNECKEIQKVHREGGIYAGIYNNLGIVYGLLNRWDDALEYYSKSLKLRRESFDSSGIAGSYNNIAVIFLNQEKLDSVLYYLEKSKEIKERLGDQKSLIYVYQNFGQYYYQRGDYTSALDYANQSLSIAKKLNISQSVMSLYELLKKIYLAQGQYEKAVEYQDKYNQISDSTYNNEKSMRIAQSAILYENELKQAEHDLKDQRNLFINITIYGILFFVLVVSILVYKSLKSRMKQNRLYRSNLEMEKDKLNLELETKNSEMIRNTIHLAEKNELLINLRKTLHKLKSNMKSENKPLIQSVLNDLKVSCNNAIWEEFEVRFIDVHRNFYKNLLKDFPDLTQNELRLAAFLKLNMNTKEISMITRQSINSLTVARTRLRKKLNLSNTDINLYTFLNKY